MKSNRGIDPSWLKVLDALLSAPSLEAFFQTVRICGKEVCSADDIEIALMHTPEPGVSGDILYYAGATPYAPDQLLFAAQHSAEHPLFDLCLAGNMSEALEPEDVAGIMKWRESALHHEVDKPNSIHHTLFATIVIPPCFLLSLKGVRFARGRFKAVERNQLLSLQQIVHSMLKASPLLLPLCQTLHAHARQVGAQPFINALGGKLLALSKREAEVLHWIEAGKQDAEIAAILGIGIRTVHTHVGHILQKLHCENRLQLMVGQYSRMVELPELGSNI